MHSWHPSNTATPTGSVDDHASLVPQNGLPAFPRGAPPMVPLNPHVCGVGAVLQDVSGRNCITDIRKGGSVALCGKLALGDEVLSVDGVSTMGIKAVIVASMIAGAPNTLVQLSFRKHNTEEIDSVWLIRLPLLKVEPSTGAEGIGSVGAVVNMSRIDDKGVAEQIGWEVTEVVEGGGAWIRSLSAGCGECLAHSILDSQVLKVGDVIVTANGVPVSTFYEKGGDALRGRAYTRIVLQLVREGVPVECEVVLSPKLEGDEMQRARMYCELVGQALQERKTHAHASAGRSEREDQAQPASPPSGQRSNTEDTSFQKVAPAMRYAPQQSSNTWYPSPPNSAVIDDGTQIVTHTFTDPAVEPSMPPTPIAPPSTPHDPRNPNTPLSKALALGDGGKFDELLNEYDKLQKLTQNAIDAAFSSQGLPTGPFSPSTAPSPTDTTSAVRGLKFGSPRGPQKASYEGTNQQSLALNTRGQGDSQRVVETPWGFDVLPSPNQQQQPALVLLDEEHLRKRYAVQQAGGVEVRDGSDGDESVNSLDEAVAALNASQEAGLNGEGHAEVGSDGEGSVDSLDLAVQALHSSVSLSESAVKRLPTDDAAVARYSYDSPDASKKRISFAQNISEDAALSPHHGASGAGYDDIRASGRTPKGDQFPDRWLQRASGTPNSTISPRKHHNHSPRTKHHKDRGSVKRYVPRHEKKLTCWDWAGHETFVWAMYFQSGVETTRANALLADYLRKTLSSHSTDHDDNDDDDDDGRDLMPDQGPEGKGGETGQEGSAGAGEAKGEGEGHASHTGQREGPPAKEARPLDLIQKEDVRGDQEAEGSHFTKSEADVAVNEDRLAVGVSDSEARKGTVGGGGDFVDESKPPSSISSYPASTSASPPSSTKKSDSFDSFGEGEGDARLFTTNDVNVLAVDAADPDAAGSSDFAVRGEQERGEEEAEHVLDHLFSTQEIEALVQETSDAMKQAASPVKRHVSDVGTDFGEGDARLFSTDDINAMVSEDRDLPSIDIPSLENADLDQYISERDTTIIGGFYTGTTDLAVEDRAMPSAASLGPMWAPGMPSDNLGDIYARHQVLPCVHTVHKMSPPPQPQARSPRMWPHVLSTLPVHSSVSTPRNSMSPLSLRRSVSPMLQQPHVISVSPTNMNAALLSSAGSAQTFLSPQRVSPRVLETRSVSTRSESPRSLKSPVDILALEALVKAHSTSASRESCNSNESRHSGSCVSYDTDNTADDSGLGTSSSGDALLRTSLDGSPATHSELTMILAGVRSSDVSRTESGASGRFRQEGSLPPQPASDNTPHVSQAQQDDPLTFSTGSDLASFFKGSFVWPLYPQQVPETPQTLSSDPKSTSSDVGETEIGSTGKSSSPQGPIGKLSTGNFFLF